MLEVPENRFKKVPTSTAYEKMPKDETPLDAEKARKYRTAVGILIYISPERADVQASVRLLGSWVTKPRWCDWMELKHLVQYLSFTCVYGQLLPVSGAGCSVLRPGDDDSLSCVDHGSLMQVFTDSNWAGCQETRKSVSCAHYWVNSILVYTQSKTQRSIALSSCEAEFLSAVSGCAEGLYLRRLVEKIVGLPTKMELRVDSSSARSLLMKSGFQRTRHIAAGVLWIQDRVAGGELEVKPVSSLKNTSDLGTKGHGWKRLMFLLFCIGMYDTERQSRVGIEQYEEQMQCVVNKGFLKAFRIHMIEHLGQEAKPSTAILNKIGKLVVPVTVLQSLPGALGQATGADQSNPRVTSVMTLDWNADDFIFLYMAATALMFTLWIAFQLCIRFHGIFMSRLQRCRMRHICTDVPMFAVTVKGERFHKLTCKHVKNRQITRMTETELMQLKLTACKDCLPGTDEAGINFKMNSKLAMKPTNQRSKAS